MKKRYIKHLNEFYADTLSESQALDYFEYLTDRSRKYFTSMSAIRVHHQNHMLGDLVHRYDQEGFEKGFTTWKKTDGR